MNDEDTLLRVDRSARTLRELALEKLRDAILGLRFQPGDRLVERDLCDQLGVSRSIVREVLRHLETEGLVENVPYRGPIVVRPTPDQAKEIYEIRAMLEALAARTCAETAPREIAVKLDAAMGRIEQAYAQQAPTAVLAATHDFYKILFQGSGKAVAWTIVNSLNARISHLRAMTISTAGRSEGGPAEMRRIVEAIGRGDGTAAAQACLDHVGHASAIAQRLLSQDQTTPP
ncbi:GntR family transcriptional regulator [Inquilinus sp. YAF38]|uniref:GntR family transcriptional regulator n=1 Tax=Inquilinus sp. YAF38 TaxID=3233084 RepID=UPI003F8EF33C